MEMKLLKRKDKLQCSKKDALPTLKVVDTPRITATAFVVACVCVPTFFFAQLYLMIVMCSAVQPSPHIVPPLSITLPDLLRTTPTVLSCLAPHRGKCTLGDPHFLRRSAREQRPAVRLRPLGAMLARARPAEECRYVVLVNLSHHVLQPLLLVRLGCGINLTYGKGVGRGRWCGGR